MVHSTARVSDDDSRFTIHMVIESAADRDTDRRLVARLASGDSSAVADLYDAHAGQVYALAVRIVGDRSDAEDVVQEVFAQAWRQASRYDAGRATVIGWLLMMTRARAIDRIRARRARFEGAAALTLLDIPSADPGQEAAVITSQTVTRVRAALDALGESSRVALELAYYEGLSQSAIAARLGEPLGTIKTRMRTALARLRDVLRIEES